MSFSLPVLIAVVVVGSMSLLGALLMWQGWQVARQALITSARDSTLSMGRLVDEKMQNLLAPASITLRHLGRDPLLDSPTLDQRLERLDVLSDVLRSMSFVSAVYVGYPDGDFILLRPLRPPWAKSLFDAPPEAAFLVQSVSRDPAGRTSGEWRFYDNDLRFLGARLQPDYAFDPRVRPWYKDAEGDGSEHVTQPYIFFTTNQIGLTLSRKASSGGAVVGLDMDLSDFGTELGDMRLTPHSDVAVVGADGIVYGYPDLARIYRRVGHTIELTTLDKLGAPALSKLAATGVPPMEAAHFQVNGETWFGISMPLVSLKGRSLNLLMATPDSDLLAAVRAGIARQLWWVLGLFALLLFGGWFVGDRLGRGLANLTRSAQRLTSFDFRMPPAGPGFIKEIRELEGVLGDVCRTIQNFLTTTQTIGNEARLDRMLEKVLQQTVAATNCTRGAVYLLDDTGQGLVLVALAERTGQTDQGGQADAQEPPSEVPPQPFPSHLPLSATGQGQPAIGTVPRGRGQLALLLTSRDQTPLGLVLLEHPADASHEGSEFRAFAEKLSGALSSSVETRRLIEAQKKLLDGFVLLIADAIDAKSPYTGGHCRRVPELATMIVDRMASDQTGPYKDFHLSEEERYEFHLGAWLHDCGKVTSPEHVIDKATKLEAIHNRIHEVRTRFEVLWRDAEIAHLKRLADGADPAASEAEMVKAQEALRDDFAFVAACNVGGEFMTDEAVARIHAIAQHRWLRHFDDRLGLSIEEERRLSGLQAPPLPALEPLIADRPDQVAPWSGCRPPVEKDDPANVYGFDMALPSNQENLGEIYNLTIRRGTLTAEERFKINDHVVQTYMMLKSLPWPEHLARVPEIAATHHERMDGTGYPRHLPGSALSVEERVMALADVFEALTACDRPYKSAKTLTQSLRIMAFMCKEGHLDPQVFRYFLTSGLWEDYADRFLKPEQRDGVDLAALLAILPDNPAPLEVAS